MTAAPHLAAILATDAASCCRLPCGGEAGTAKAVRERREAAMQIVRSLGGRLVRTTGDGGAVEFPTVASAVECATLIQKMMAERNLGVAEGQRVLFRVGVNLGAVLIEGDDILGEGVNIARQLEASSEPGGVCLSNSAFEKVRGRIDAEFIDLGEQSLRNIDKLARAYLIRAYELTPTAIAAVRIQGSNCAVLGATGEASGAQGRGRSSRWPAIAALVLAVLAAGAFASKARTAVW
jgi:class 3 adenylate cyclase